MLCVKVLETEASNAALKAKVKASESKENTLRHELAELRERARELAVKNGLMQHDIAHLTSALAVRYYLNSCLNSASVVLSPRTSQLVIIRGLMQHDSASPHQYPCCALHMHLQNFPALGSMASAR